MVPDAHANGYADGNERRGEGPVGPRARRIG